MENNVTTSVEKLIERVEDYGNTTVEIFKLNAINKSSEVFSSLITRLVIAFVVTLFILIASIGLALWVGKILGETYYGFFAIAGFYVLLALILYATRNTLIKLPIRNSLITQMLKD